MTQDSDKWCILKKCVEEDINEKIVTKTGALNDGVLESWYFLKQKPEPVTHVLSTFIAPLVCLQRGLTFTWHSWCSSNGELLTLLLTYPRLYFSLLLYMSSMCLDGSSPSGWLTPVHLSRATLNSSHPSHLPHVLRACPTSICNTALRAVVKLSVLCLSPLNFAQAGTRFLCLYTCHRTWCLWNWKERKIPRVTTPW